VTHRVSFALVGLLLALAACSNPAGKSSRTPTGGAAPLQLTPGNAMGGHVYAPAGTLAGSAYRLDLAGEQPVAGAPVFSVATDGSNAIRPQGKTGADGQYAVEALPVGKLFRVRVHVKTAQGAAADLETLAKAGQSQAADIDVASTMLALTLAAHAKKGVIAYDPVTYARALAALQGALGGTLPDPSDPTALVSQTEALAQGVKDLNAVVGGTFTGVTPTPGPGASPLASASPTPAVSPTLGTSATPAASPTTGTSPTPAVSPSPSPTATATP